jgi:hypothetical protein
MNLEIIRGEAPEGILRIDRQSSGAAGQDHAHFRGDDDSANPNEAFDLASLLRELEQLPYGEHVHLDEFCGDAPKPGSKDWLPGIESVTVALRGSARPWTIVFPVGHARDVFRPSGDLDELVERADASLLLEPPSVVAVGGEYSANTWAGELAQVRTSTESGVIEVVSIERSRLEGQFDDPFSINVYREIHGTP